MQGAFFQKYGLEVGRKAFPLFTVKGNEGLGEGARYRTREVVGYFKPLLANSTGPAGHRAIQDTTLNSGVNICEGHRLRIGAQAVWSNQIREHVAVSSSLDAREIIQSIKGFLVKK